MPSEIISTGKLLPGQRLVSPNRHYTATLRSNGSFVVESHSKGLLFQCPNQGNELVVQDDGNFVLYSNGRPTWASNTWKKGTAPFKLAMQDDGNLVLYEKNGTATWASNTWQQHTPATPPHINNEKQQVRDELPTGGKLFPGESLVSKNGIYTASLQNGKLTVESSRKGLLFQCPNQGNELVVQDDGNFVLYSNGNPTWASNTWKKGTAPFKLAMQDDGNLVLYDSRGTPTWATNTWQRS